MGTDATIRVKFQRSGPNIKGVILKDCIRVPMSQRNMRKLSGPFYFPGEDPFDNSPSPLVERSKIVFIFGYRPENVAEWNGNLPLDDEEWQCAVIRDTLPDDPDRGALLVKLVENITARDRERLSYLLLNGVEDLRTALVIEEIANFAKEKIGAHTAAALLAGLAEKRPKNPEELAKQVLPGLEYLIARLGPDTLDRHRTLFEQLAEEPKAIKCLRLAGEFLQQQVPVEEPKPLFKEAGDRHFECLNCGYLERIGKATYKLYLAGEAVELTCPKCFIKAMIKK